MSEKYGVGKIFKNKQDEEFQIIEYLGNSKVKLKFLDNYGYETIKTKSNIWSKEVKNPYFPIVYGVGYLGVGLWSAYINNNPTKEYSTWKNILKRCFCESYKEIQPTYTKCEICDEWLNFQNFAEWYDNNYPHHVEDVSFEIDKDLLSKNNKKIYSEETCVFIPSNVNLLLSHKKKTNTSGHVGVCKVKKKNDIVWRVQIGNFMEEKPLSLGQYANFEEAVEIYNTYRVKQVEKAKNYLRSLNYLPEEIIQLIK